MLKEIVLLVQEEHLRILPCRTSPTLMYTRLTWGNLVEVQIPIQDFGKGLRVCTSNQFPDYTDATDKALHSQVLQEKGLREGSPSKCIFF